VLFNLNHPALIGVPFFFRKVPFGLLVVLVPFVLLDEATARTVPAVNNEGALGDMLNGSKPLVLFGGVLVTSGFSQGLVLLLVLLIGSGVDLKSSMALSDETSGVLLCRVDAGTPSDAEKLIPGVSF